MVASAGHIGFRNEPDQIAQELRSMADEEFIAKELGPKWQHDPEVVCGF